MSNISDSPLNATVSVWRHPPWYQYDACAVAPYGFVFYFGVKVFNLAVGFPTNVLVMWQIMTKKSEGSTSDIFIFNLSILDAYFCLMTPVDMVNRIYLDDQGIWYFQRFAYGLKDMGPLFLTCICLDRYVAVVHPILFTGIRDNRIRVGVSIVVWGLILAYALTKCILGVLSVNEVFSGLILSAFFIMVFCNLSIIWVLPPVALMPFASTYSFVTLRCKISISVFSIMDLSCTIEPLLHMSKMEKSAVCPCLQSPSKKPVDVNI